MSVINEINVRNLFGRYNYRIPLNRADNITIIHGPNGCGKTWILQLINAIYSLNYPIIRTAPFDEVEFKFQDRGIFIVHRYVGERSSWQQLSLPINRTDIADAKLTFTYSSRRTKKIKEFSIPAYSEYPLSSRQVPLSLIEREIPQLERVGAREWIDESRGEILSLEEVRRIHGNRIQWMATGKSTPRWLSELTERISVNFIQSQRLIRVPTEISRREAPRRRDITQMVEHDSQELAERIKNTLAQSGRMSQSKDRTFPTRLMSGEYKKIESEPLLREELDKINTKRQLLYSAGLLDQEEEGPLPTKTMREMEKNVLSLYIQDQSEKLHVFDDLQKRIATLMDLINSKFQAQGKYLVVDRDRGFLFKTDVGGGRIFRPAELSSGEQQQLVIFYELIFKTSKKSLVLIDEPEISLDVGWQRKFLNDLTKVISLDRISVLMATHSPQIINNRRDLAVPLSGGVKE